MKSLEQATVFFTGATSGLGKVSALDTANKGATVIALCRNQAKGEALIQELQAKFPQAKGHIELIQGDLNDLKSIQAACETTLKKYPVIDQLVNNAGIMNFQYTESVNHIEQTLQVNLLAPVFISELLFPALKKSEQAKVIFTSSAWHKGDIQFSDLEFKKNFSSFKSYSQSKLGVILMTKLLAKKWEDDGIGIYAQHPGVVNTDLGRSAGWFSKLIFKAMGKSSEKGAETLSFLIDAPKNDLNSGAYYLNKAVAPTSKQSHDLKKAQQLFDLIQQYLKPFKSIS